MRCHGALLGGYLVVHQFGASGCLRVAVPGHECCLILMVAVLQGLPLGALIRVIVVCLLQCSISIIERYRLSGQQISSLAMPMDDELRGWRAKSL
jgi:hypothetical protein